MTNYEKYFGTPELAADSIDRATNEDRDDWEPIGCTDSCIYKGTHHSDPDDEQYECGDCEFVNGILAWLNLEAKENQNG